MKLVTFTPGTMYSVSTASVTASSMALMTSSEISSSQLRPLSCKSTNAVCARRGSTVGTTLGILLGFVLGVIDGL